MIVTTKSASIGLRCPLCHATGASAWKNRNLDRKLEPSDLQITDHRYGVTLGLWKCAECHFVFAAGDEIQELEQLYEQLEDHGYEESQEARTLQMRWLLKRIRQIHPSARSLLDIGAGAGLLVATAQKQGMNAVGVEPSTSLVEFGRREFGVTLHHGVFPHPDLQDQQFDLVLLVDVIEHVANPVGLLVACRKALAPDGQLLVVTPNRSSVAARCLGKRWWHLRLAHVGYFDRGSLAEAFDRAGLEPVRWFSAKWFFRIKYVATRLEQYLPVATLNRLVKRFRFGRWVYDHVVPVNPFDSMAAVARGKSTDTVQGDDSFRG